MRSKIAHLYTLVQIENVVQRATCESYGAEPGKRRDGRAAEMTAQQAAKLFRKRGLGTKHQYCPQSSRYSVRRVGYLNIAQYLKGPKLN